LVVDAKSTQVERTIALGERTFAEAIAFAASRRLYVAAQGPEPSDGSVLIIDPDQGETTARIHVGGTPRDVVLSSDGCEPTSNFDP